MTAETDKVRPFKGTPRRRHLNISYVESGGERYESRKPLKEVRSTRQSASRRDRVYPERRMVDRDDGNGADIDGQKRNRRNKKNNLRVSTTRNNEDKRQMQTPGTGGTDVSTPRTPADVRGSSDLRSPGAKKSPIAQAAKHADDGQGVPDFITQTDANGNATTPRSAGAIQGARIQHPSGPRPRLHVDKRGNLSEDDDGDRDSVMVDPCDTLLDSIRLMCCCLLPEETGRESQKSSGGGEVSDNKVRLLGPHHPDDAGKKCLVLDLDETLVHSSFRAVPGADFVIPVQIEDVVHFVYVAKRPGVDEFLTEMAKHYEIVIYTASLNKYADPLLDLLDPNRVIRARLFRESCVYYEGNYVKDLSLLDRDLSQSIIVDNSPSSYIFHPENAIDCSSFIDDPSDRELDQIGAFLTGTKHVKDVRDVCHQWRDWPVINYKDPEDER